MGKKINVFRENDVEYLKTYLAEVVREVVFGEAEEEEAPQATTIAPEVAAGNIAKEMKQAINKYYAGEGAKQGGKAFNLDTKINDKSAFTFVDRGTDDKGRAVYRITIKVPGKKALDSALSGTGDPRQEVFGAVEGFVLSNPPSIKKIRIQRMKGKKGAKEVVAWNKTGARASGGYLKKGMIYLDSSVVQGGAVVEVVVQGKRAEDPNRGELSEAWMALAIAKRFMNLPQVKIIPETGKVPGMVSPQEVMAWVDSGGLNVVPGKGGGAKLTFGGKVTNLNNITDTIKMQVELRAFSLEAFYDAATKKVKVGKFAKEDKLSQQYLKAACEYANRELIPWAVGVLGKDFEGGDEEESPHWQGQELGWFINEYANDITISAVGTDDQSLTKVDLEMTCKGECPFTKIKGGIDADPQLARMSLKAGNIKHFGGGAATNTDNAVDVMENVFPVDKPPAVETWQTKHDNAKTFAKVKGVNLSSKQLKARKVALNDLVTAYIEEVENKLDDANPLPFIKKMVKGLLDESVRGAKGSKFEDEAGVILVQATDKGDFFKLDFNKLDQVFAESKAGPVADAKGNLVAAKERWGAMDANPSGSPYLAVYRKLKEGGDSGAEVPPLTSLKDKRVLFTMRALAREGAEILRLEKGPLMKELLEVGQNEYLVYRGGEMVTVDAEGTEVDSKTKKPVPGGSTSTYASETIPESLEKKVFAILKEGLKIT